MFFSVIIPVFNRPEELAELLRSLSVQSYQKFEAIVVEDGSGITSESVVRKFKNDISITYLVQSNQGQGFARNNGMSKAKGDFFIILDSDVILPRNYLWVLDEKIREKKLDAFGGPDAAASDFSSLQKAMDFAMTSFWTTGGIRGKLKDPSKYQARGFNMGVSKTVFLKTGGFADPNRGEDIEWSIRIKKAGFKLELVEEAFVYHKRKNTLISFAKQAFSFGRNRVNVSRFHSEAIKLVHLLPTAFSLFLVSMIPISMFFPSLFTFQLFLIGFWGGMIFLNSLIQYRSASVALLSIITSLTQLVCYGFGLVYEYLKKLVNG
ncbi:MAG: glycosyltransferase [Algoriphagus sp.]|uniref:glycosyltransferase n=1 Tax=Algoriphagus sp. TaxID=1872435 RepID=UPI002611883F|nr:glycosyltransferase [Algoriphagus sp.]MDG1276842.1 glycosyltransferase [Algoriphagus sp.]